MRGFRKQKDGYQPINDSKYSSREIPWWSIINLVLIGLVVVALAIPLGIHMNDSGIHIQIVPEKSNIQKWESGMYLGRDNYIGARVYHIADQLVVLANQTDSIEGRIRLFPGTTLNPEMYPKSFPDGDPDNELTTSNLYSEELWLELVNPDREDVDDITAKVISIENGGTELVLSHVPYVLGSPGFWADVARGYGSSNPTFGNAYRLRRVRMSYMPYSVWVMNPDNNGNAIIKATYAVNGRRNSMLYMTMAKWDTTLNNWKRFVPTLDSPAMKTTTDERQVFTWVVSNLEQGELYSVNVGEPDNGLVSLFNAGEPELSYAFLRQMRFAYGNFQSASFRMPYKQNYNGDVRLAFVSCEQGYGNAFFQQMSESHYDAYIRLGDGVYGDFGGTSLIRFNHPKSAGTSLGFGETAHNIYPTVIGASNITFPLIITTNNQRFLLDEQLKQIPPQTYNDGTALLSALQTLFGGEYQISLVSGTRLNITRLEWSTFGYDEMYLNSLKATPSQNFLSSVPMYKLTDDHEVTNNYQSIPAYIPKSTATSQQVALHTAVSADPNVTKYGFGFLRAIATSGTPYEATVASDQNIMNALRSHDRYFPRQFVGASIHNSSGYVRTGNVEIIKMDTMLRWNTNNNSYEYYQLENKFMRDDQLDFLIDRLTHSTAKVKVVLFSRQIAMTWYTWPELEEQRLAYVASAVNAGYTAELASETFYKVVENDGTNFVNGYFAWYNNTFIPRIKATKAKNVFFMTGGNHYGSVAKLVPGLSFIEAHSPALGISDTVQSASAIKYGADQQIKLISLPLGYNDLVYHHDTNQVSLSFYSEDKVEKRVVINLE